MKKKRIIDLHIHSNFSDGKHSIEEVVNLYGSKGFSAIAITDHIADSKTLTGSVTRHLKLSLNEKIMDQYLETIQREAKRALEKYNMHVIAGCEITLNSWSRNKGAHIVFLGIDRYINPDLEIEQILLSNTDSFSIAAHPLWQEEYEFKTTYLWENRHKLSGLIQAWECATAKKFSPDVFLSGYSTLASSDFHSASQFAAWRTQFYSDQCDWAAIRSHILLKNVEPVWII